MPLSEREKKKLQEMSNQVGTSMSPQEYERKLQMAKTFMNEVQGRVMSSVYRGSLEDMAPKTYPPREPGSERSYAFESRDASGRKTTRYSDKPKRKKGERRVP